MPAGSVQTILVCQASGIPNPIIPCPDGTGIVAVQAYIIDSASANFFDAVVVPFDPVQTAAFFTSGFCITFFVVWIAWQGGEIIDIVKRILGIKH